MPRVESQTLLGLGWLEWALGLDLALMVAVFTYSVLVVPSFFLAIGEGFDPTTLGGPLAGVVAFLALSAFLVLGVSILGFAGLHALRTDPGVQDPSKVARLTAASVFAVLALGLFVGYALIPRQRAMFVGLPDELVGVPEWAMYVRVLFAAAVAFAAGVALTLGISAFAGTLFRRQLWTATALGVVSAASGCLFGCTALMSTSTDAYIAATISGAVAGEGTAIISLLLFLFVLRSVRRSALQAARMQALAA